MRKWLLVLMVVGGGCMAEPSAVREPELEGPVTDEEHSTALTRPPESKPNTTVVPAPADYWTWYPVIGEEVDVLAWTKQAQTRMSGGCCGIPVMGSLEQGPFIAEVGTPGFPEGTKARWELPYKCQHPGDLQFELTVMADGVVIGEANRNVTVVESPAGSGTWTEELRLGAASAGAVLSLAFKETGCAFFIWGRGGDWATRLAIQGPDL